MKETVQPRILNSQNKRRIDRVMLSHVRPESDYSIKSERESNGGLATYPMSEKV